MKLGLGTESTLSGSPLSEFVELFSTAHGFDLHAMDSEFLARSLEITQLKHGLPSPADLYASLLAEPAKADRFIASLRISFSEFFRDPFAYAVLEKMVLPRLFKAKVGGAIRAWSAGCATGEEAWSLAMLLEGCSIQTNAKNKWRLWATDKSQEDLDRAQEGVYEGDKVTHVRLGQCEASLRREGAHWRIGPHLREKVVFAVHDLLGSTTARPPASVYGGFNLICCANVMLYYRPQIRQEILAKLRRSLVPGGYLLTSSAERHFVAETAGFREILPGAPVFIHA